MNINNTYEKYNNATSASDLLSSGTISTDKKTISENVKSGVSINPDSSNDIVSASSKENITLTISKESLDKYNEMLQQQLESDKVATDALEDNAKIMEIARRISAGDHVPPEDEKKLMEFSFKLYQAAKSAAVLNAKKKPKEYDSLFDEENNDEELNAKLSQLEHSDSTYDQNTETSTNDTSESTVE